MRVAFIICLWSLTFLNLNGQSITPVEYRNDPLKVKFYTLDNGLQVYLTENHDSPKVFGAVVVKAGGKTDPAHATGMAHYLEHMLFKGTTRMGTIDYEKEKVYLDSVNVLYDELGKTKDENKRKNIQKQINGITLRAAQYAIPNELDQMLSEIGGEDVNAFTDLEMTVYHNTFPGGQIEKWIDVYAHRFQNPVFRLFQSELETVYEEKNIGMDNPMSRLFEKFMEKFYKVHPYGQQTIIGTTEHLKNPSLTTMYEYFNKYYVPNNMALVMSGDFNADEIFPLINEKFGKWNRADLEKFPTYKEEDFKGKEKVRVRYTPIKVGALGYRTPSNSNMDYLKVNIIAQMLSNGSSGFIDELADQGKVITAGFYYDALNDYGHAVLYFIPKIFGQSLKKTEKLMYAQIQKIQNGDFDDSFLQAVKNSMMIEWERMKEYNEDRALEVATAFASNKDWGQYLIEMNLLRGITKEEVMEAAKKYFGENCLSMYSKMGFAKKDKLQKPDFAPVQSKKDMHSEYYYEWKNITTNEKAPKFVDFEKDLTTTTISSGVTLYSGINPFNSVFTMRMKFGNGKYYDKNLKVVPYYLNIADSYVTNAEFKRELFVLGATVFFSVNDHQLIVSIEGLEENLEKVLSLLDKFLTNIKIDDAKIKKIKGDMETEDKVNKRNPSYQSNTLNAYVNYGDQSFYLTELSTSEIGNLEAKDIVQSLKDAMGYETKINYAGQRQGTDVAIAFRNNYLFPEKLKPAKERVYRMRHLPSENTIYILNDKKARQSRVNFFVDGKEFTLDELPLINTFNKYFGGDMSSLVFQEIRELRSLAYSTYGGYYPAYLPGQKNHFMAYVGCQADKTNDAIAAMNDLIHEMPEKDERMEIIRSSLVEESKASRPGFRYMTETITSWQERGFDKDANQILMEAYKKVTFDEVVKYYKKEIKGKPTTITIVGDMSKIDKKALEKYGKIIEVKSSQLVRK